MARRTIAKLVVDVAANVATFVGDIEKANRKLQRFQRSAERTGQGLTRRLTLPIALVGGAAIKMAADAAESENLFAVSMGDMEDEARSFSENLSKSLGLNAFEIRKQVGTINLMLKSMGLGKDAAFDMAKGITQLTQDLASMRNLQIADAFEKIQSGITGEAEPLKRLGVLVDESTVKQTLLNEGLIKQGQVLTQQQKTLGRYITIVKQTVLDQGDLARTSESAVNRFRRLVAQIQETAIKIGALLLPAFTKVIGGVLGLLQVIKRLVDLFKQLPEPLRLVSGGLLLFATIVGPTIIGVAKLVGIIRVLGVAMTTTVNPIVGVAVALAAIAAVAGVIALTGKDAEKAAIDVEKWKLSLEKAKAAFGALGGGGGAGGGGRSPGKILEDLSNQIDRLNIKTITLGVRAGEALRGKISLVTKALEDLLASGLGPTDDAVLFLQDKLFGLETQLGRYTDALDAAGKQQDRFKQQSQSLSETLQTALVNGITDVASSLGELLVGIGDGFDNFGKRIIGFLGGLVKSLGQVLVAFGVAGLAIQGFLSNPLTAIAAGAALIALGSALSAAAKGVVDNAGAALAGGGGGGGSVAPSVPAGGNQGTESGGAPVIINFDPSSDVMVMNPDNPRSLALWIKMFEAVSGQRYVARPSGGQLQFLPRGA